MRDSPELSGGREEKEAEPRVAGRWVLGVGLRIDREGREGVLEVHAGVLEGGLVSVVVLLLGPGSAMRCSSMLERRMCSSSTMCRVSGSRSSQWYLSRRAVNRPVQ